MNRVYKVIFFTKLKSKFIYKIDYITSLLSPFFKVYIYYLIWSRVVEGGNTEYTKSGILIYLIMGGILGLIFTSAPMVVIAGQIRSGKLPYIILRPMSILGKLFIEYIASSVVFFLILIGWLFINSNISGIFYIIMSFYLYYLILISIGNLAFKIIVIWPFRGILNALILLFGGTVYPLDLLPERFYNILQYNPLAVVFYRNIKVLGGEKPTIILFFILSCWILIFFFISKISLKKGLKKYEGLGL